MMLSIPMPNLTYQTVDYNSIFNSLYRFLPLTKQRIKTKNQTHTLILSSNSHLQFPCPCPSLAKRTPSGRLCDSRLSRAAISSPVPFLVRLSLPLPPVDLRTSGLHIKAAASANCRKTARRQPSGITGSPGPLGGLATGQVDC